MIEKVTLKELNIVKRNGHFVEEYTNIQVLPCKLTNYSLKRGKELGLLKQSLLSSLFDVIPEKTLKGVQPGRTIEVEMTSDVVKNLDELDIQRVIYLGLIGARPTLELSFDEFLMKYHASYDETMTLYSNILVDFIDQTNNNFVKGFEKSTKRGKKKQHHRR